MKTFGYPEFFVPGHHLPEPLREGALVEPAAHEPLLDALVAWQVEHDAVDPLGLEHSWRLSAAFVRREVEAVRAADPTRPVLMNGFLPTSAPVRGTRGGGTRREGRALGGAGRRGGRRRALGGAGGRGGRRRARGAKAGAGGEVSERPGC